MFVPNGAFSRRISEGLILENIKKKAILDNVDKKIKHFNRIGIHYEAVYHYIIRKRKETDEIYDKNFIDDIVAGLISFDMQRMMGKKKYFVEGKDSWAEKLHNALNPRRVHLENLRSYKLQNVNFDDTDIGKAVKNIFNELSKPGPAGLCQRRSGKESFPVGASKILHFIIPDLFIILDSNARRELIKSHGFPKGKIDGDLYLEAMRIYQRELNWWEQSKDDPRFQKLLAIDTSWKSFRGIRTTPLPRIVDKCTFVGEKFIPQN